MLTSILKMEYLQFLKKIKKDTEKIKRNTDAFGIWFNDNCEIVDEDDCRVSVKELCVRSGMSEKLVKEVMKRKGLEYDKKIRGKGLRGGYKLVKINEEEEEEIERNRK
jgi:hypothetical protein